MQSEYVEPLFKNYQELGDGNIGALNPVHDLMKSPNFPYGFEIPHLCCALGPGFKLVILFFRLAVSLFLCQ